MTLICRINSSTIFPRPPQKFKSKSSANRVHDFVKMALNARLLGRAVFGCHGLRPAFVSQIRPVTMQPRPAQVPVEEGYDERNMRLARPQSPHLTIYKFQLTSMLSITHRFTGIILTGYTSTLAFVSILSNKPMGEIIVNISTCYPTFFLLFKLGLIFPFTYHFFNGIRHLIWDAGKALTIKGVYITGYIMLLCSFASFAALFYLSEEEKRIAAERAELERLAELERKAKEEQEKLKKKKKKK